MGVKLSGNNQGEGLLQLLQEKIEAEGQAAIAARKAQTIREMVPRIQQESVAREKADVARQLKQEIEKRKEKEAAKSEGGSPGAASLESISQVNPVDGNPARSGLNIYNIQQGQSKTGSGGTLTGQGGLGGQAFNVPSSITTTEETTRGGDLGQRGALIRQGPQTTSRTLTRPNVMTPADVIALQQQKQRLDQSYELERDQLDFNKDIETKKFKLHERLQNTEIGLASNRDRREQQIQDRNIFLDNRTFSDQMRLDFPEMDAERRQGIEKAYASNDFATITRLTSDLGEGVTTKLKRQLASRNLDKIDAEIEELKSKAVENYADAGIFIQTQAGKPDFLSGAGLTSQDIRDANDPVSSRHLQTQTQSFPRTAMKEGELDPSFRGPLESLQQRWFARGQMFMIGKDPGLFGDANTGFTSVEPAGEAMVTYLASLDPKNPFRDSMKPQDIKEAKNYLVGIGIAKMEGGKLVPTENNELPWTMLVQGAHRVYGYGKANKELDPDAGLPKTGAGPDPTRPGDPETGVPLSGKEAADKWKAEVAEIDKLLANQSNLEPPMIKQLEERRMETIRRHRGAIDQMVVDKFRDLAGQSQERRAAAEAKAREILSRGK